ncbi:MAG: DUF6263 family protein [Vicinamibacterales bacterium]
MAAGHRSVRGVAAVAAVVIAGAVLLAQDVTLRYHWNKDETLRYRLTQETAVTMTGTPMGDMQMGTTMGQVYTMTARDVTDASARVEATFESIRMVVNSPAGSMAYDTSAATKASDPVIAEAGKMFDAMVGKSMTVTLTPTGGVEKVEGLSALSQAMQGAMPQGAMPGSGLDTLMSDDAMKGMFSQSFQSFPGKAVRQGETWQNQMTVPNPLAPLAFTGTHTFTGLVPLDGRDVAHITSIIAVKPGEGGGGAGLGGLPMTVTVGAGNGDTETWFDHRLGRVVKMVGHMTLPMTMSMTAPDGSTLSMDASTRTTTTMELVK